MLTVLMLLLLVVIISGLIYVYLNFQKSFQFWKLLNVPYLEPSFPTGNLDAILKKKHFAYIAQELYEKLKSHGDYAGIYFFKSPVLIVLSPEFAKTILIKDFQYFVDRGVYFNKKDDPLSANLFFIEGPEWRLLRTKISPTFTSGKMKMMFNIIHSVGTQLIEYLNNEIVPATTNGSTTANNLFEVRDLLARYTTDVIGSCAFGLECNSIMDPNAEFRTMGKKMFTFSKLKTLKMFFAMLFREQARALHFRINEEDVTKFVIDIVRSTIEYRNKHNIRRNDFLQLMIDLYIEENANDTDETIDNDDNKNNSTAANGLTLNEISAQVFVFFLAGFETSSTTVSYTLYELALNQDIQNKLRQEIITVIQKHNNEITYEGIAEMQYMDQIFSETLRKYPAVATLHRVALKDYQLPNGSIIPKGTNVLLPSYGFHHDEDIFPKPNVFDPDRFNEINKLNRHPFAYLPFGEGPRICVGMRFGILQAKVGIAMLLNNFKFNICEKTEIPLTIDPVNLLYIPLAGVYLNIEKC